MSPQNSTSKPSPPPSSELRVVDSIIHARWLIPMTDEGLILHHHSLVISDHKIIAIAATEEINKQYQGIHEYSLSSHAVIPGLINTHGHSPMTLFRGYADDMPLHPWLEERIWPAESKWVSEEFVADGAQLAMAEMLLSGTTCFSDMYFFPDQIAKSAIDANIRVQIACPILDFPTIWAQDADEYIAKTTMLYDQFKQSDHVIVAFGPHAPYTVSDAPLQKVSALAHELDIGIHIHLHENPAEIENAIKSTGVRPLQRLYELGLLSPRLQCAHLTQVLDDEITLLANAGVNIIHCPASNMKLASGFCPAHKLSARGINLSLGTDGAGSNNSLSLLNEMRLAALIGKGSSNNAAVLPAWQVLAMATINGAKAMSMESKIGSLEVGKFADITAVNLDHVNTQPVYNPVSSLVYSAEASQVSHVWVAGKINVEEGKLNTLDPARLMQKAQIWSDKINCS